MTNELRINRFLDGVRASITHSLPAILEGRFARTKKPDESYVTSGDLLVQTLVLAQVKAHLPESVCISEEMAVPETKEDSGIVIVIDPIDGTENFASGLPEWGISVACYDNSAHVASLIGCPEMNQWLRTGDVIHRYVSRIAGLSSSLSRDDLLKATEGYEYRVLGCCVYNMINVVRGSFASFENPKGASSWDILAGLNLARERGLIVTVEGQQYAGEYLSPDRKYRFKIQER